MDTPVGNKVTILAFLSLSVVWIVGMVQVLSGASFGPINPWVVFELSLLIPLLDFIGKRAIARVIMVLVLALEVALTRLNYTTWHMDWFRCSTVGLGLIVIVQALVCHLYYPQVEATATVSDSEDPLIKTKLQATWFIFGVAGIAYWPVGYFDWPPLAMNMFSPWKMLEGGIVCLIVFVSLRGWTEFRWPLAGIALAIAGLRLNYLTWRLTLAYLPCVAVLMIGLLWITVVLMFRNNDSEIWQDLQHHRKLAQEPHPFETIEGRLAD